MNPVWEVPPAVSTASFLTVNPLKRLCVYHPPGAALKSKADENLQANYV
jgi:hypothetical protein